MGMLKYVTIVMAAVVVLGWGIVNVSPVFARTVETHKTLYTPWSGYWWPYNGCGLGSGKDYYGHPSPLEKYEQFVHGTYPLALSNWYRNTYCQEEYPGWYGHCGHWSFAALWENFEIFPSAIDNYVFRVGDKKGLLTLLHTKSVAAWGNGANPDEFHLWLLKYVKDERRGFVVDMDKGEEVWQYPVYQYTMTSQRNGNTETVHVNVVTADDGVIADYVGTQNRYYNFYYTLFLNAAGDIIGGEWTGESLNEHPSRMYAELSPGTTAPLLDPEKVREIARTKDDALEKGADNVLLSPGLYNLILLDPDPYVLDTDTGSRISLKISLMQGGGDYIHAAITDKNQTVVLDHTITAANPLNANLLSKNPPYLLTLSKTHYQTPGIYTVVYDTFREFSHTIPYIPKDGNWSGFAVTNYSKDPMERVALTSYTKAGQPLQTLWGPLTLNAGQKMQFFFHNLPYRQRQYADVDSVRLASASDSGTLNLISGRNGGVAEMAHNRYRGSHIILPDTVKEQQPNYYMTGKVINESDSPAKAALTLYNAAGMVLKTVDIELDPRQAYEILPGSFPFYSVPNNGWMEIRAEDEDTVLTGFQHIVKYKGLETNFALPATAANKIVPHIPFAGAWKTDLVLINTGDQKANMVLHRSMAGMDTKDDIRLEVNPKTKITVPLHTVLDTSAAYPYYRSIVSISSDQAFTGYYAYQSFNYEDYVTLPLLEEDDFAGALVLPHNTQGAGWGTGVGIFNPGAGRINFDIKPYGPGGTVLPGLTLTRTLDPGEYAVLGIDALFPGNRSKITFFRFETQKPGDIIGGFHLYYSLKNGMCGENLQPVRE